jgi:hypothetical protein
MDRSPLYDIIGKIENAVDVAKPEPANKTAMSALPCWPPDSKRKKRPLEDKWPPGTDAGKASGFTALR